MENQENNEEINLTDFVKVVIKRKKIIFSLSLLSMAVILLISFFLMRGKFGYTTYSGNAIVEIGLIGNRQLGSQRFIESSEQLAEKINNGLYGSYPSLKASSVSDSLVSFNVVLSSKEETEKAMMSISNAVLKDHNDILDQKKKEIETQIKRIENIIYRFPQGSGQLSVFQLKILDLQENLEALQPSQLIKKSVASVYVDNSKKFIFSLIAGMALSLFIGFTAAFFKEWWDNNVSNRQYF